MRPSRSRSAERTMPPPAYNADARQQAAGWVVRLDAGELTAPERAAFEAWLARDPSHAEALERARVTWGELELLGDGALGRGPRSLAHSHSAGASGRGSGGRSGTASVGGRARQRDVEHGSARRLGRRAAALACVALAVIALGLWQVPRIDIALRADARTGTGETQRVALVGGGFAQLDTASAIRIHESAAWRDVQVLAGTVSFEVGHDDPRPFRVHVGDVVVTDVGTTFQVRRSGEGTQVVVASGEVGVAAPGGKATVRAGEMATLGNDGHAPSVAQADADAAMAWTRGRLMFVDRPLKDVVTELNRYYPGRIVILDDRAGARRVSGVFRTNDPLAALGAIETNLGLHATHVVPGLVVLR